MAVNLKGFDAKGDMIGDILPEYVSPTIIEDLSVARERNSINNGYSPDKTLRKVGSIPQAIYYNYPMYKGVPPDQHSEFWTADNGKNLISFLEEFPTFKLVEKPI